MTTKADADPIITRGALVELANMYLGDADPKDPLAAPLYADLKGLPPLLIQVGTAETLFDDSTRLAKNAKAVGVDVVLEPWDNMIHVWHLFAPILDTGQRAIDRIGEYVVDRIGQEVLAD